MVSNLRNMLPLDFYMMGSVEQTEQQVMQNLVKNSKCCLYYSILLIINKEEFKGFMKNCVFS